MTATGPVVVTGASGFIGRALIAHFAATHRAFRAVVRRASDPAPGARQRFVVTDLATMPSGEEDVMLEGAVAIVHLAGRAHVPEEAASDSARGDTAAAASATVRLARAALRAGVERFVFASSVKVNGEASRPGRAFTASDAPDPRDAYARSKLEAERRLAELLRDTATVPIVLRLPLVYGPGVKGNFAALLDAIARRRALPLGAIDNRRSVLYVGNLVEAIDAALDAPDPPGGIHFVADAQSVSVPALVTAAAAALGIPVRMPRVPVRLLELAGELTGRRAAVERLTGTLEVDPSAFRAATGWRPRHSLAAGLAATAAWWRMRHSI